MEQTTSTSTTKVKSMASYMGKGVGAAVILAVLGLGVLMCYDLAYLKMDGHSIIQQLKGIWEQGSVYLTTCATGLTGVVAWSTVKIAQIIDVANNYVAINKDFLSQVDAVRDLFIQTIRLYISLFIDRQNIQSQKQSNLNQRLLLIQKTIFDDEVLNALNGLNSEYEELDLKEKEVVEKVNDTFNHIGENKIESAEQTSESIVGE